MHGRPEAGVWSSLRQSGRGAARHGCRMAGRRGDVGPSRPARLSSRKQSPVWTFDGRREQRRRAQAHGREVLWKTVYFRDLRCLRHRRDAAQVTGDAVRVVGQQGLSDVNSVCGTGQVGLVLMQMMPVVLGRRSLLMTAISGCGTPYELHRQQHDEDDDQGATHESMLAVGSWDGPMRFWGRRGCARLASHEATLGKTRS